MRRMRLILTVAAGAGCAAAGACTDYNARTTLGGRASLPAVTPHVASGAPTGDAPSVRSLDRSNWAPTLAEVPVDGTVHRPTYTRQRLYDKEPVRRMGLYPTAQTALDLDRAGSPLLRGAEVAAQAPRALVEVGLMPLRMVFAPPWVERESPMYLYKRQPPGGWLTGGRLTPGDVAGGDAASGGATPGGDGVGAVTDDAVETIEGDGDVAP